MNVFEIWSFYLELLAIVSLGVTFALVGALFFRGDNYSTNIPTAIAISISLSFSSFLCGQHVKSKNPDNQKEEILIGK